MIMMNIFLCHLHKDAEADEKDTEERSHGRGPRLAGGWLSAGSGVSPVISTLDAATAEAPRSGWHWARWPAVWIIGQS